MGDHLQAQTTSVFHRATQANSASYPQAGGEMSTGQSAVMLCGWRVKAGWLIPLVDKRVGGR